MNRILKFGIDCLETNGRKNILLDYIMVRFKYIGRIFFLFFLFALSLQIQGEIRTSSFSLSEASLNQIRNGAFVYEVNGVGQFVLSGEGGVTYEYSSPSIWGAGKKRHRLVMNVGQGNITAVASDARKRIQINRVSLSGYAYGSFDVSYVELGGTSVTWYTDASLIDPYVSTAENLNVWNSCPLKISGKKVSVVSIEVEYTVYDYYNPLMLSDLEAQEYSPYTYVESIVLDRDLAAGWNTLCLPFDCSVSELGDGVVAQQFVGYEPASGLDFAIVDQLEANKPYLLYCPQEIPAQTITFGSREIHGAVPQSVSYNGMTFIGNYEPGFSMYGKYGVAQNRLVKGGVHATVNGTRAYFEYTGSDTPAVLRVNYQQTEGTTAIKPVESEVENTQGGVYNLQGVCVRSDNNLQGLPAGIYIVNGRKVTVKQ